MVVTAPTSPPARLGNPACFGSSELLCLSARRYVAENLRQERIEHCRRRGVRPLGLAITVVQLPDDAKRGDRGGAGSDPRTGSLFWSSGPFSTWSRRRSWCGNGNASTVGIVRVIRT